jgi:hypothetical protein
VAWFAFAMSKLREKAAVSQQSSGLISCWRSFNRDDSGPCYGQVETIPDYPFDTTYEGLPAGDFVHPGEEEYPLQVRAAGWTKAIPDVGQHVGHCPSGMEQSIMFQYMFLQVCGSPFGLRWSSRSLGDIRSLVARAD